MRFEEIHEGDTVTIVAGIHNVGKSAIIVNACPWLTGQGGVTLRISGGSLLQWARFNEISTVDVNKTLAEELELLLAGIN